MILLVIDTSGKNGFVALARASEAADAIQVIEETPLAGGTFSAQLVPQISGLLEKHGIRKTGIGGFIVVSGPGSFTGLRVGLAAIKALAEILEKPIVPLSQLGAISVASGKQGKVLAMLDAGRGEVYAGEYDVANGDAKFVLEQLLTRNELVAMAKGRVVVTPDEALAAGLRALGVSVSTVSAVRAEVIAKVGWGKLCRGETVSAAELEANYIRRSDAEIFAKSGS